MVIDTSALLAVFFNEAYGPWVTDRLTESKTALRMSTVNYSEALILIQDRQPHLFEELRTRLLRSPIRMVPPSQGQAEIAAEARLRYPLNLGDCFAYALAKDEQVALLTLDRDFRRTDLSLVLPETRTRRSALRSRL